MRKFYMATAAILLVAVPVMLWAAADGAALYAEKCAMCHGEKGENNGVKGTAMTVEALTTYLLKGDPEKSFHANPVGEFNEEQAKAVAEFIKTLK